MPRDEAARGGAIPVVRRATADDLHAIEAMFVEERELSGYGAETLERSDLVAWLAEDSGVIAGAILTHPMTTEDDLVLGGVDELLVSSAHRGRGVGRALMAHAEAHYRERGAAGMQLTVRDGNKEAQALYDSLGYTVVHRRVRMRKKFG
jgi:ribosomal protein S18 acetylase RimI-like enzyme